MTSFFQTLLKKKALIVVVALGLVGGGVAWAKTRKPTLPLRYVIATASKGSIVTAISGSGQVSGENQIDLKPTVSAQIVKMFVTPGQSVSSSQPLFLLDPKEGQKAVRDAARAVSDAQISLSSSELSLKKLQEPPDAVSLLQAENSVKQAQRTLDELREPADPLDLRQAESDLQAQQDNAKLSSDGATPKIVRDTYDNAVATLKSTSQTIIQTLASADNVLGVDRSTANSSYQQQLSAQDSVKLETTRQLYKQTSGPARALKTLTDGMKIKDEPTANIETAIDQTQDVLQQMDKLTAGVYDVLQATVSSAVLTDSTLSGLRSTAQSDRSTINGRLTSMNSLTQAIDDAKDSYETALRNVDKAQLALDKLKKGPEARDIASAEERVQEAQASLDKLKKGPEALDILSAQNTINQRHASVTDAQNKLRDAQDVLANYTVRAPFDGIIAKINVKEKDQASPSTALATVLTHAKVAQVTLNEVDVSKIKVGQKATLTFDAVTDLTIAGTVSEVDSIGTVSQGVVSYNVKILFITQDDRIKTGMSVSASIITDSRVDVLTVPNAALSNGSVRVLAGVDQAAVGNAQGVESTSLPEVRTVQAGLSNDQSTEILSGLNEGELIVTRVIDPNIQTTTAARAGAQAGATTGLRIPGLTTGGGAAAGATFGGGGGNFTRPAGR